MSKAVSIQVLRALSAVVIIAAHAVERSGEWHPHSATVVSIYTEVGRGAVMLFFVISGFIIVHSSYHGFGKEGAVAKFALNRVVRIVPMYWLATMVEFTSRSINHTMPSLIALASSLFFIPQGVAPGPGAEMRPLLGVGWTLNYEVMFYTIFAACMFMAVRSGIAAISATMVFLVICGTMLKPLGDTAGPTTPLEFWTDPIILTFLTGVMIGAARRSTSEKITVSLGLPVALAILGATCAILVATIAAYPSPLLWRILLWVACGLAVGLCAFESERPRSIYVAPWEKLGDATYSVYLFHFMAIVAFEKIWKSLFGEAAVWMFVVTATVFAAGVGWLIYITIERPVTDYLRAAVRGRAPPRRLEFPVPKSIS